jgi:predicted nucleic acid-binding protein
MPFAAGVAGGWGSVSLERIDFLLIESCVIYLCGSERPLRRKARYKLHYADSFAAALAIEHKATLITSDSDFRKLGHDFPVVWLK